VESYAWTLNGESISNDASIVLSSLTAGDYDVAVITSNPLCGETQSDVAVVSPLPDVNAGQDVSVCEGESVTLNGVSNDEITWSNGATNGNEFVPNESTTLMASASNEFGCSAVDEMSIVVNPLPSNIIDVTGNTLSADNGNNYQWYFNGAPVNGATNQTFTANNSGNYFVEITSEEGCVILSETVIISSIEKGNDQSVSIYPNPMNLSATIILPNGIFQMDIFDMTGRCVFSKANCQGIMNIERNGMAAGRYSVQFKNAERFIVKELQVD